MSNRTTGCERKDPERAVRLSSGTSHGHISWMDSLLPDSDISKICVSRTTSWPKEVLEKDGLPAIYLSWNGIQPVSKGKWLHHSPERILFSVGLSKNSKCRSSKADCFSPNPSTSTHGPKGLIHKHFCCCWIYRIIAVYYNVGSGEISISSQMTKEHANILAKLSKPLFLEVKPKVNALIAQNYGKHKRLKLKQERRL